MSSSQFVAPSESKDHNEALKVDGIEVLFERFLAVQPKRNKLILRENKQLIIKQAFSNLGVKKQGPLSALELKCFEKELNRIVYLNSGLPNFIVSDSKDEEINDDELENPETASDEGERYARNARNALKHISRGVPLCKNEGESYSHSPLAKDEIIKSLLSKRNPRLLEAFRIEIQKVFDRAFDALQAGQLTPGEEKQYEIFQGNLLAAYPFTDPLINEKVNLPQKMDGQWRQVKYQFKRFDISPKSGPLSWVLEEEDHIYAYALVAEEKQALSHLLLMGTAYPAGQGASLAVAYNFYPQHSIGEAHDMTEIDAWLEQQKKDNKKVQVAGHSKGATMAIIVAARNPKVIVQADCLNPAGLCGDTLDRLTPAWNKLPQDQRPCINVYAQLGDPVFPLEKGYLIGTNIYRVIPNTNKFSMNCGVPVPIPRFARKAYEAHIHHFTGRNAVLMLKVDAGHENNTKRREIFNGIKYVLNWLRFPLEYCALFMTIMMRKVERFYKNHRKWVIGALILTALVVCSVLAYTGVLVPLVASAAKPILTQLGISLTPSVVYGITAGLSIISSSLVPLLLKWAGKLALFTAKTVNLILLIAAHMMAIIVGSVGSGLKVGIESLYLSFSSADLQQQRELLEAPTLHRVRSSSALVLSKTNTAGSGLKEEERTVVQAELGSRLIRSKSLPNHRSIFNVSSADRSKLVPLSPIVRPKYG